MYEVNAYLNVDLVNINFVNKARLQQRVSVICTGAEHRNGNRLFNSNMYKDFTFINHVSLSVWFQNEGKCFHIIKYLFTRSENILIVIKF